MTLFRYEEAINDAKVSIVYRWISGSDTCRNAVDALDRDPSRMVIQAYNCTPNSSLCPCRDSYYALLRCSAIPSSRMLYADALCRCRRAWISLLCKQPQTHTHSLAGRARNVCLEDWTPMGASSFPGANIVASYPPGSSMFCVFPACKTECQPERASPSPSCNIISIAPNPIDSLSISWRQTRQGCRDITMCFLGSWYWWCGERCL